MLSRCSRPPAVSPQVFPRAPLPPPRPLLLARPAAPRSPLAQSGSHEPLPGNHFALKTRCCRPLAISQGPPSGTSALPPPACMDRAQTSPLSAPLDSDTLAPLALLRCTAPLSP